MCEIVQSKSNSVPFVRIFLEVISNKDFINKSIRFIHFRLTGQSLTKEHYYLQRSHLVGEHNLKKE